MQCHSEGREPESNPLVDGELELSPAAPGNPLRVLGVRGSVWLQVGLDLVAEKNVAH